MLRPCDLVIDAFVAFLRDSHASAFPDAPRAHVRAVERAARMALPRIATTDALYHDLDHTICVVQVGQDLLRGRIVRDGDVGSGDWAHLVAALLCHGVGFCKGAVRGDTERERVIDEDGRTITLQPGQTDAVLWRYAIERSKLFVRDRLRDDPVLDARHVADLVEGGRFPPKREGPRGLAALARDAHLVGTLANPRFPRKLTPFFIEIAEAGLADQLGFDDRASFEESYAESFWERFHPHARGAMELLAFTGAGREWLATLRAHVLRREHAVPGLQG